MAVVSSTGAAWSPWYPEPEALKMFEAYNQFSFRPERYRKRRSGRGALRGSKTMRKERL